MNTGQTMMTLGAFVLLSTILLTFYRLLAESGETIDSAQAGITAVSMATSYMQFAQGLHFDETTQDSFVTQETIGYLTDPSAMGPDVKYGPDGNPSAAPAEDGLIHFDDVDDLDGQTVRDSTLEGTLGDFAASFTVYYVNPNDVNSYSAVRTFVKRIDILIWREFPPSTDTLRTSLIVGYWLFSSG